MSSQPELQLMNPIEIDMLGQAEISVGGRQIFTPQFSPLLKSKLPDEMDIFLHEMVETQSPNSKSCVVRLSDAREILGKRTSNLNQMRVDDLTRFVEERFVTFQRSGFPIIDPATEYLYYGNDQTKWMSDGIPKLMYEYGEACTRRHKRVELKKETQSEYLSWKRAYHRLFWNRLSKDAQARNSLIGDIYDEELRYGSPFMLPPVPLITDDKMLDICLQINSVGVSIGAKREAAFANYFVMPSRKVADKSTMSRILEFVRQSPILVNVFKFKYQDLSASGNRSRLNGYRDFLQEIALLRGTNRNRLFVVLDNGYQAFSSATVAFDIVSTSMTGLDLDGGHGQSPYGWWFDPEQMIHISFEDTREVYRNSGNVLPCGHARCKGLDLTSITPEDWNDARRHCYYLTMCDYMRMISEAIAARKIELTIDKLNRSDLVRLRKLIPRV